MIDVTKFLVNWIIELLINIVENALLLTICSVVINSTNSAFPCGAVEVSRAIRRMVKAIKLVDMGIHTLLFHLFDFLILSFLN